MKRNDGQKEQAQEQSESASDSNLDPIHSYQWRAMSDFKNCGCVVYFLWTLRLVARSATLPARCFEPNMMGHSPTSRIFFTLDYSATAAAQVPWHTGAGLSIHMAVCLLEVPDFDEKCSLFLNYLVHMAKKRGFTDEQTVGLHSLSANSRPRPAYKIFLEFP